MYEIPTDTMSEAFFPVWRSAAVHLNRQLDGGSRAWLRAHPYPPFLEHLSFRLGNQLFFVRVVDADGVVQGPGPEQGHVTAAGLAEGRACCLPMRRVAGADQWSPVHPGWGLLDAHTGEPMDPMGCVTDELIPMTAWELQDVAVQVVRDRLEQQGRQLMSWQGNPEVDPSIWFVGESQLPEWVVVRVVTFPNTQAVRPGNWEEIARNCAPLGATGHFASVSLASSQQAQATDGVVVPLWRGHALTLRYRGLE